MSGPPPPYGQPPGYPQPSGYPQPYPPAPQPYQPPQPPAPRRGLTWKLALLICLPVLLVAALCFAGVLYLASRKGAPPAVGQSTAAYTPNPALQQLQRQQQEREAARAAARTAISTALTTQGVALLAGDQARFLGFADPSAKRVRPWLAERFGSLRAMGIARWDTSVTNFTPYTEPRWQADVEVRYCFAAGCTPLTAHLHTMWNLADQNAPRITEMWEYTRGRASPPWARSALKAKVGGRVVVATTAANAGRLTTALATAEAAARVADSFAGANRPGKYVVYLAGAKEWAAWPYGAEGKWVAGYADQRTESVVVQLAALRSISLSTLLRHELGHVATLAGQSEQVVRADSWWLSEGLAEYVSAGGKPFAQYFRRAETASFVRKRWKGDLRVGEPTSKTSIADASGRYGTAYLGVTCLAQRYGRAKMLGFVHAVAVTGSSLTGAAQQELGQPWTTVSRTCVAQVRAAVN